MCICQISEGKQHPSKSGIAKSDETQPSHALLEFIKKLLNLNDLEKLVKY